MAGFFLDDFKKYSTITEKYLIPILINAKYKTQN
jgi:hypothetical protein